MTTILLVEDDEIDAQWVCRSLRGSGETPDVVRAASVAEARHLLGQQPYDALVVDLSLPDASPERTLGALLAGYEHLPVVVLTGCQDEQLPAMAIASGVEDYLVKGEAGPGALRRSLSFALARCERHAQMKAMALRDGLTGLANREEFDRRLDQLLSQRLARDELLGLALVDVDDFKALNDSRGHRFGDKVLRAIAKLLVSSVRRSDTVARLGGDEFVVILEGLVDFQQAYQRLDHLYASLQRGLLIEHERVGVRLSTGLALAPAHGTTCAQLIEAADSAMYRVKRTGRGRWGLPGSASARAYALTETTDVAAGRGH